MLLTRRTQRRIAYAVLLIVGAGPFLAVLGAAAYLRSPMHRESLQQRLTAFFGLHTRIGSVVPLGWSEYELHDVEIFLPNGANPYNPALRVAHCRQADWVRSEDGRSFDLKIHDGSLDLTPARWAKGDFTLLERSLLHDYPQLNLHQVEIYGASVRWGCGDFSIELDGPDALVWFDGGAAHEGVARLSVDRLNGQPVQVLVEAKFNPLAAVSNGETPELVRQFVLTTMSPSADPIPVATLHLDKLIGRPGQPIASGTFLGTLCYQSDKDRHRRTFEIRDAKLLGLQLAEFSSLTGRLDLFAQRVTFDQAEDSAGRPQLSLNRLQFSGNLNDCDLAAAMRLAGQPECAGRINVQVFKADIEPGRPIRELELAGQASGLDLAQLSVLAGDRFKGGCFRGQANLNKLLVKIRDGRLENGQAELQAVPASGPDQPDGLVDRRLLEAVSPVLATMHYVLPLPERIAYRGLKLQASPGLSDDLIFQGAGGDDAKSFMTLLLPDPAAPPQTREPKLVPWRNIPAPEPIDMADLLHWLARPIPAVDLSRLRQAAEQVIRKD